MVNPRVAVFGQKDYQQLKVIEAMVAGLAMPFRIVGAPTVREPDGLARSSRNVYLDAEQRRHALGLHKALHEAEQMIKKQGETDPAVVETAMQRIIDSHHMQTDYAAIRHPHTLAPIDCINHDIVALVAARNGPVRLLDNRVISPD